jgi:RES domain-containing protein
MPRAWRIVKRKYAAEAFDGEGARLYGGRWSSPGTRTVYVAESLALATLEILVHLQSPVLPTDYVIFTVDIPPDGVEILPESALPVNWRLYPPPPENQSIGDEWTRQRSSLALRVPSAITTTDFNYLLNPQHPDFHLLAIQGPSDLDIDPRVFQSE